MKVSILGRKNLEQVLELPSVIEGVKSAYRLKAAGKTVVWPLVSYDFEEVGGVMDIRSGCIFGENLHGLKMLNNFPANTEKGLPPFNGMLMIFDSTTGIPLGVMDAAYITCMRTGAAGAIGAQALARSDSEVLLILGAGKQSIYQIAAALTLLPGIKKVYIADALNQEHARTFAAACAERLQKDFSLECSQGAFLAAEDLAAAVGESDIIITITPSRSPVILKEWVKPGTHFSCIGADMEGKEEIDPTLFQGAKIYADDVKQCVQVGEMELPIKQGVIREADIAGEIGQVLSGEIPGRCSEEEITIFDATGLALLDLVTGKRAIDLAQAKELGILADI
ncbi:ornithine cyclodeaminase family protein [Aminipila butyrica]|uniref:Ornithine cyclodeaminase family protein n=1 Tax=Aminipila butyrica TaxID=433296 RepID=A0A858BXY6_9FIRM|nr:ornithine cyclodeaminase family protein [Aminipila butyrica]QIB70059.1 ornithine cyclodeaminase family protein [Aminipila butyrica]